MTCHSGLPWKSVCSTWRRAPSGRRVCFPQTKGVKCIGNTLTIGKKCEDDGVTLKTFIHELGHVLGLYHEMNRGDRDQYIEILEGRMKKEFEGNFKLPSIHPKTLNTPYDFLSIMHYSQYAFTRKQGCVTIRTKNKCAQNLIGKTKEASYYDIKAVNTLYKCNIGCGNQNYDTWKSGGYGKCGDCPDCYLDRACTCICPEKWQTDLRFLPPDHRLFKELPADEECRKGSAPMRNALSDAVVVIAIVVIPLSLSA